MKKNIKLFNPYALESIKNSAQIAYTQNKKYID